MKAKNIIAAALTSVLSVCAARASVVTFENYAGQDVQTAAPIISGGFSFSEAAPSGAGPGAWHGTPFSDNGTESLIYFGFFGSTMTMVAIDGRAFDVKKFDAGLSFYTAEPTFIATLTGTLQGGGTVTDTFNVIDGYRTFAFNNLNNLTSLTFTAPEDGYITVDNISVGAAAPEPAIWAMLLAGFSGLGLALRRRSEMAG